MTEVTSLLKTCNFFRGALSSRNVEDIIPTSCSCGVGLQKFSDPGLDEMTWSLCLEDETRDDKIKPIHEALHIMQN